MQTIPTPYLIKSSLTKNILRESVKDIVPQDIINTKEKLDSIFQLKIILTLTIHIITNGYV